MRKIVIDTNIIIDYLRIGHQRKTLLEELLEKPKIKAIISVATLQELFVGQSTKKTKEEKRIKKIVAFCEIKNITPKIAEIAGKILRDQPSGKMSFPDAKIAATAILEKAYLLTRDKKDFQNIKGLKIYQE